MTPHEDTQDFEPPKVPQPTLNGGLGDGCRVLLIRHGRSADIIPGSVESSDPPLHQDGEVQAIALGNRLRRARVDAVYSSHLRRAVDTAARVAQHHDLEVIIHEDLEEVRLGDWSHGVFRTMAANGHPDFVAWSATGRWDGIPNGEGDQNFRNRVSARIDALAAAHTGGCIAIVCHGGVINAYLAHILGTERSLWMMVENTSITTVKVSDTRNVLTVNDCNHLYDLVTDLN